MMIELYFYHGTELIIINIKGKNVSFTNPQLNGRMFPLQVLTNISNGVYDEIQKKIDMAKDEETIKNIIIDDLKTDGYTLKWIKKA